MSRKQFLQMLATCVAVIALTVVMLSVFGVGFSAVFLGLAILCPLSHWLMMRSMEKNHEPMKPDHQHLPATVTSKPEEQPHVQNCH